ncbi:hypothetical protein DL764_005502 [Monosporascus ibericus]|uniref:protein-ribulosamine 3-kinase n=1 Tax=Monosporascus ibericus TaxID=155417 RepID=A0A4Q4T8R5_9PEZI|nr:hypothetical protein DL764_005502 [Monosporascus ibericus]
MGNEDNRPRNGVEVPIEAIQAIDPGVVARESRIKVTHIEAHGASFWTRTARLGTERDGVEGALFLKPIAWGSYLSIPEVHFFLCEFRPMTGDLPDLETFPAKIAELHRTGTSPDGRFGFDLTTFHGETPIDHGWSDTWEEYFRRTTRVLLQLEQEVRGSDEEIQRLSGPFFERVVPRLLRPLGTGGHSIRPSLIHGDLWHGNASTDKDSGMPIIFDAASLYAHNESVWRQPWNKINKPYRERYHEHFPKSYPEADYDGRNLLYATRVNVLDSILYKNDRSYREMLIEGMRQLVEEFSGGFEQWEASQRTRDD